MEKEIKIKNCAEAVVWLFAQFKEKNPWYQCNSGKRICLFPVPFQSLLRQEIEEMGADKFIPIRIALTGDRMFIEDIEVHPAPDMNLYLFLPETTLFAAGEKLIVKMPLISKTQPPAADRHVLEKIGIHPFLMGN